MATGRLPDPNTAPLTAKGDLYTYSTVPARLAVGSNGDTLVADSSATTGLRWQGNFAAGKNKIINGDFYINQRGFTSNTADGAYNFDRWMQTQNGASQTVTPQTFTPGTAPVAGYEGKTFLRSVVANSDTASEFAAFLQKIEDVRTFAGQTITVSFWAKAASGTPKIALEWNQQFGSGGSPSTQVNNYAGQVTISTSWARYSITYTVPSISGKTIGTTENTSSCHCMFWISAGSDYNARTGSIGHQNNTFDIWGVQVEAGSVATPFSTATGTLAGELAACQRYYYTTGTGNTTNNITGSFGFAGTTTRADFIIPVGTMRVKPSSITTTNVQVYNQTTAGGPYSGGTWALNDATTNFARVLYTHTGTLANAAGNIMIITLSANDGLIAFNAEL